MHTNFNDIYKRLDYAYTGAQERGNEKLMGGIVGIWAKMCADAILRDKLFHEGERVCTSTSRSSWSLTVP